jgi:hypothetical protein
MMMSSLKHLAQRASLALKAGASATRAHVAAWPLAERIGLTLAAAWLLGTALIAHPRALGDGGEYFLMAESFAQHLSPEARPADIVAVADKLHRQGIELNVANMLEVFFPADDGRRYCYHFWGYSLGTLPARFVLRGLGMTDLKAPQLTNALLFLFALHHVLFAAPWGQAARRVVALLTLFSPIAWYVLWPHPEAACASAVLLGLIWSAQGRHVAGTLAVSLAAMQNPPLAILAAALWVRACAARLRRSPGPRRAPLDPLLSATLALLPTVLPALFFLWRLGEASPLARVSTDPRLLSWQRALELFFDLNLGMLPYLPGILVVFAAATLYQLVRLRTALSSIERLAMLLAMAFACTLTHNWNSGAAGLSRYGVWLLPLVLMGVGAGVSVALATGAPSRNASLVVCCLVIASQTGLSLARGGLLQADDSTGHSYAAKLVLAHAPSLYNPTPHIFVSRTKQMPSMPGFAVYRDDTGRCRKAYVRPKDGPALRDACGDLPQGTQTLFATPKSRARKTYVYVDY